MASPDIQSQSVPLEKPGGDSLVHQLLAEWESARERGQSVNVEVLCKDHPELIDAVRRGMHFLEQFHSTQDRLTTLDPAQEVSSGTITLPDHFANGRYELRGELGRGGMGVVYRAWDAQRQCEVALKTLPSSVDGSVIRFKQEFRALADLHKPNLVKLYELGHEVTAHGTIWFFTMELVTGSSFLDYVRPPAMGRTLDEKRLRHALRELAGGLQDLHNANRLHRDLKPSNVLVTSAGRVVLLDFGLAAELNPRGFHQSVTGQVLGTIGYMAPEQAAGTVVSAASDWYAVGVMLFQALTNELPFGSKIGSMLEKQIKDPPEVTGCNPQAPADLAELCMGLIARQPEKRMTIADVLARLGSGGAIGPPMLFVGRDALVDQLQAAIEKVRHGKAVGITISGVSGVGKSSLLRHFFDGLPGDTVVLQSRCYEREAVPFKAIDGAIDALCRHLQRLPEDMVHGLLPRKPGPLLQVFPVFGEVRAIATFRAKGPETGDAPEIRRRAFAGLRELLARLSDRGPVVLTLDDVQWGDLDSAALLTELLHVPDPPALLTLIVHRSEMAQTPVTTAFRQSLPSDGTEAELLDLVVPPLSTQEIGKLAEMLLEHEPTPAIIEMIAQESAGLPFFVQELTRMTSESKVPSLAEALGQRIAKLNPSARKVLEAIAVAGAPVPAAACLRTAGLPSDDNETLNSLFNEQLIRYSGNGSKIVAYHDRLSDAVASLMPAEAFSSLLEKLVHELAQEKEINEDTLAAMVLAAFQRAGKNSGSAVLPAIMQAAENAKATLAFDRAAEWYQAALTLPNITEDDFQTVRVRLERRRDIVLCSEVEEPGQITVKLAFKRQGEPDHAFEPVTKPSHESLQKRLGRVRSPRVEIVTEESPKVETGEQKPQGEDPWLDLILANAKPDLDSPETQKAIEELIQFAEKTESASGDLTQELEERHQLVVGGRYRIGDMPVPDYRIDEFLGEGGFGCVYKVTHIKTGVQKALRVIKLKDTQGYKEYMALALFKEIRSPYLVPIENFWLMDEAGREIKFEEDESLNIAGRGTVVLHNLVGLGDRSLADRLKECMEKTGHGIPVSELMDYMDDLAKAIDYLNTPKTVGSRANVAIQHGDIKPANMLLVGNSAQLADYGLAQAISVTTNAGVSRSTSGVGGTPEYAAPEQIAAKPSRNSDQYSLAISYYEMRTGKLPFDDHDNRYACLAAGGLDFSLVHPLEHEVMQKATHRQFARRYNSCRDFVKALRNAHAKAGLIDHSMEVQALPDSIQKPVKPPPTSLYLDHLKPGADDFVEGFQLVKCLGKNENEEVWELISLEDYQHYLLKVIHSHHPAYALEKLFQLRMRQVTHEQILHIESIWVVDQLGREIPDNEIQQEKDMVGRSVLVLCESARTTLENYIQELKASPLNDRTKGKWLEIVKDIAQASQYSNDHSYHKYEILQPATILVNEFNQIKLDTPEVARLLHGPASSLAQSHAFDPPELVDGMFLEQSHQYSLAMIYYWLFRGHACFPAQMTLGKIRFHLQRTAMDFSRHFPAESEVLCKATLLDPMQRYPGTATFISALEEALEISPPGRPSIQVPRETPAPYAPITSAGGAGKVAFNSSFVDAGAMPRMPPPEENTNRFETSNNMSATASSPRAVTAVRESSSEERWSRPTVTRKQSNFEPLRDTPRRRRRLISAVVATLLIAVFSGMIYLILSGPNSKQSAASLDTGHQETEATAIQLSPVPTKPIPAAPAKIEPPVNPIRGGVKSSPTTEPTVTATSPVEPPRVTQGSQDRGLPWLLSVAIVVVTAGMIVGLIQVIRRRSKVEETRTWTKSVSEEVKVTPSKQDAPGPALPTTRPPTEEAKVAPVVVEPSVPVQSAPEPSQSTTESHQAPSTGWTTVRVKYDLKRMSSVEEPRSSMEVKKEPQPQWRASLEAALGDALANAGRRQEAASAYQRAIIVAGQEQQTELKRKLASVAGQSDE